MKIATLGALMKGDLANAMIAETPGGIEAQEAAGQRSFVANSTLPIEINYGTREQFEAMGIVFGKPADDLFVNVQLPAGWKKERTDHSMWSHLLDGKGRKRASIFYKAAFYDMRAHMSIERRYSPAKEPEMGWEKYHYEDNAPFVGTVHDAGIIIWRSEAGDYDNVYDLAKAWLDEHYPEWENPLAYWD